MLASQFCLYIIIDQFALSVYITTNYKIIFLYLLYGCLIFTSKISSESEDTSAYVAMVLAKEENMRPLLYMAEKLCSHFFLILWGEIEKIVKEEERKWLLNYTALLRRHICHWFRVKATSEGLFFTPKLNCFKLNTFSHSFAQSLFYALYEDLASHISDTEHFCHE